MRLERLYRTEGIVLRRQDFGEADRVITLYSPIHGKLRAVAKGVRRPKSRVGGHVELFTHVNVLVAQGRNLDLITQAEAMTAFGAIRDSLWTATFACYCAELVDRLTEERLENRAVFDLLLAQLAYLNGTPEPSELSVRAFELALLRLLGYAPELYRCVECGEPLRPIENRISASAGGTICPACGDTHPGARPVSVNAVKAMRLMAGEPFGVFRRLRLPQETATQIEGATRAHITFILERQLRTADFLDRLKASERRPPTRLPA